MCVCDIDSTPDIYNQKQVCIRKDRQCDECARYVDKGSTMIFSKGLWDGSWGRFYHCIDCEKLWQGLATRGHDCIVHGELYQEIFESYTNHDPDARGSYSYIVFAVPWLKRDRSGLIVIVE